MSVRTDTLGHSPPGAPNGPKLGTTKDCAGADDRIVQILGTPVDGRPALEVLAAVDQRLRARERTTVAYVNAHTLNIASTSTSARKAIRNADFLLNDGIGVRLAALLRGQKFAENLNGSDFTTRLLDMCADQGRSVFLLGGRPGVAEAAARRLESLIPGIQIVGTRDGYQDADTSAQADAISRSSADVAVVALGNPKQEIWLRDHLEASGASLGVAVGAFLDFQAGRVRRAPAWMNRTGVEWVYRLLHEPRRLWRRYVLGNPLFLMRVLRDQLGATADDPGGSKR